MKITRKQLRNIFNEALINEGTSADLSRVMKEPYLDVEHVPGEGYRVYVADSGVQFAWADSKEEVDEYLTQLIARANQARRNLRKIK